MNVRILEERGYEDYQSFVENHNGSMLYYSLEVKKFLEQLLDCTPIYYVAYEENEIVGVLPLMYKSGRYGTVINSLPFYGSNGGILSGNDDAKRCLISYYN